jgi:hypothetical protein
LKQLQEAVGNTLEQIGIGSNFLNRTQNTQHLRERMNKWDCIKLKSSVQQRKQSPDSRDNSQNGRKFLPVTHPVSDKHLESIGNSKNSAPQKPIPQRKEILRCRSGICF